MKKVFYALTLALVWLTCTQQAQALEQKDGVYQITNADDLIDFSNLVASGNGGINGVLTADIDMAEAIAFMPIGTVSSPYRGFFDGQEHYIMNLTLDLPEQEYVGLFGVLNTSSAPAQNATPPCWTAPT